MRRTLDEQLQEAREARAAGRANLYDTIRHGLRAARSDMDRDRLAECLGISPTDVKNLECGRNLEHLARSWLLLERLGVVSKEDGGATCSAVGFLVSTRFTGLEACDAYLEQLRDDRWIDRATDLRMTRQELENGSGTLRSALDSHAMERLGEDLPTAESVGGTEELDVIVRAKIQRSSGRVPK